MTTPTAAPNARAALETVAARAVDAVKVFGSGETTVRALDGLTVEFGTSKFSAIMGPSGSGKSTLMHCLAGLDRLTSGEVFIGGVALSGLREKELTIVRRDPPLVCPPGELVPAGRAEPRAVRHLRATPWAGHHQNSIGRVEISPWRRSHCAVW